MGHGRRPRSGAWPQVGAVVLGRAHRGPGADRRAARPRRGAARQRRGVLHRRPRAGREQSVRAGAADRARPRFARRSAPPTPRPRSARKAPPRPRRARAASVRNEKRPRPRPGTDRRRVARRPPGSGSSRNKPTRKARPRSGGLEGEGDAAGRDGCAPGAGQLTPAASGPGAPAAGGSAPPRYSDGADAIDRAAEARPTSVAIPLRVADLALRRGRAPIRRWPRRWWKPTCAPLDSRPPAASCSDVLDLRTAHDRARHERDRSATSARLETSFPEGTHFGPESWHPLSQEFHLKPGRYQARVAVRDVNSGRIGSVTHDFVVPPLTGLRLTTPILTDAIEAPSFGSQDRQAGADRPARLPRRRHALLPVQRPRRGQGCRRRDARGRLAPADRTRRRGSQRSSSRGRSPAGAAPQSGSPVSGWRDCRPATTTWC